MKKMLVVSLFMIMGLCSACSKESPSTEKQEVTDKEIQTEQLEDNKELEKDKEAVHFSTGSTIVPSLYTRMFPEAISSIRITSSLL